MDVYASPDGEVQKVVMGGFSNPDTFTAAEGNFDAFLGLPVAATAASDMEEMSVPEAEEIVALTSFGAHYSSNTNNEDFNAATPQCGAGGSCQSGSPTSASFLAFPTALTSAAKPISLPLKQARPVIKQARSHWRPTAYGMEMERVGSPL